MPKAKAFAFHGGWPVKGGDGVGKCLHNGSTSVAGRRGVSPPRGQRNALGRAARTRVQISFLRGGRRRPGTLSRKRAKRRCKRNSGTKPADFGLFSLRGPTNTAFAVGVASVVPRLIDTPVPAPVVRQRPW